MADKELILVRHAKSSWGDINLDDHDRPLNRRGERNAPEMGVRLAGTGVRPQAMFTSTALRAATTAEIIAEAIGFPQGEIVKEPGLYHADVEDWLTWITGLDNAWNTVMAFGHNPGITELAAGVWGLPVQNVPTCGVVSLRFEISEWEKTTTRKPAVALFDYPKNEKETFERLL